MTGERMIKGILNRVLLNSMSKFNIFFTEYIISQNRYYYLTLHLQVDYKYIHC